MNKPELTLYHYWRSSCSWRVRWALALKGLTYKSEFINLLKGEQRQPSYRSVNPAGYIPALVVEENGKQKIIGESLAILEWLEDRWPTPALLPQNPDDRAFVRQLALTVATQIQPLQNPLVLEWFVPDSSKREENIQHWIKRGLRIYEDLLTRSPYQEGRYSFGDKVTIADLCLIPQVYSAYRFKADISDLPRVVKIYENSMQLESCMMASPEKQSDAPQA